MAVLPRVTVWSWERREDLRNIDAGSTAVAFLDCTLLQDGPIRRVQPQRNALLLPNDARLRRFVVVRITTRQPLLTAATAKTMAEAVLSVVRDTPANGLQIDFDATRGERAWYRLLLQEVRAGLPAPMTLSITALTSWCSRDRWMGGLPIDEAVPMFFRMEPGARGGGDPDFAVTEPLCAGAVGISTHERWPRDLRRKRVYVFADRGWQRDDVVETVERLR